VCVLMAEISDRTFQLSLGPIGYHLIQLFALPSQDVHGNVGRYKLESTAALLSMTHFIFRT